MRDKTAERVIRIIEGIKLPFPLPPAGPLTKTFLKFFRAYAKRALMTRCREPKPEVLAQFADFTKQLPYLIRRELPTFVKESFPPPPGGHPRKLNASQSRAVCKEISGLYEEGVQLRDAMRSVAGKYGAKPRTLQRIWKDRKQWLTSGVEA